MRKKDLKYSKRKNNFEDEISDLIPFINDKVFRSDNDTGRFSEVSDTVNYESVPQDIKDKLEIIKRFSKFIVIPAVVIACVNLTGYIFSDNIESQLFNLTDGISNFAVDETSEDKNCITYEEVVTSESVFNKDTHNSENETIVTLDDIVYEESSYDTSEVSTDNSEYESAVTVIWNTDEEKITSVSESSITYEYYIVRESESIVTSFKNKRSENRVTTGNTEVSENLYRP